MSQMTQIILSGENKFNGQVFFAYMHSKIHCQLIGKVIVLKCFELGKDLIAFFLRPVAEMPRNNKVALNPVQLTLQPVPSTLSRRSSAD